MQMKKEELAQYHEAMKAAAEACHEEMTMYTMVMMMQGKCDKQLYISLVVL